jgi:hypothetical protein
MNHCTKSGSEATADITTLSVNEECGDTYELPASLLQSPYRFTAIDILAIFACPLQLFSTVPPVRETGLACIL